MKLLALFLSIMLVSGGGFCADTRPLPFARYGLANKLDLPVFSARGEPAVQPVSLPHYIQSEKSVSYEPRAVRMGIRAANVGLAVAGIAALPAFWPGFAIIALINAKGFYAAASGADAPKAEWNFLWAQ